MKKLIRFAPKQKKERSIIIDVRFTEDGDRIITVNENGRVTEMINPRVLTMNDLRGTVMIGWEDRACHIQIRQYKGIRAEKLCRQMSGKSVADTVLMQQETADGIVRPIGA